MIVEAYIHGREFSAGVIDGKAYPIIEIAPVEGFYDYQNKYFFSASFRRDGSSRFAPETRWGNFWSLGTSWRIDREVLWLPLPTGFLL